MIDPQQRNRVLVIADIEAIAPIDGRTRASLSLQGRHRPAVHRFETGWQARYRARSQTV